MKFIVLNFDEAAWVLRFSFLSDRDQGFDIVRQRAFFDVIVADGRRAAIRQIYGVARRTGRAVHNLIADNDRNKRPGFNMVAQIVAGEL